MSSWCVVIYHTMQRADGVRVVVGPFGARGTAGYAAARAYEDALPLEVHAEVVEFEAPSPAGRRDEQRARCICAESAACLGIAGDEDNPTESTGCEACLELAPGMPCLMDREGWVDRG